MFVKILVSAQFSFPPPCAPDFKMAVKFKRRWQVNKKVKKKGKIFIFFSEAFFFWRGEGGRKGGGGVKANSPRKTHSVKIFFLLLFCACADSCEGLIKFFSFFFFFLFFIYFNFVFLKKSLL